MPNKNRGIMSMLESYMDMFLNVLSFFIGYVFVLMFKEQMVVITHPVSIVILFANLLGISFVYHAFGLYNRNRYVKAFRSIPAVLRANLTYFGLMAIITAFVAGVGYRDFVLFWILFSAIVSTSFLSFKRHFIKWFIKVLRKKQFHLRKVIIIGDNTNTAADYVRSVSQNDEYGIMIIGYVGDKIDPDAIGVDKLGGFQELETILDKERPTDVVFAIDAYDKRRLIKLVNLCDDRCIKVYFLPVIYGFFKSSRQIEQIGTTPTINIHSTPLDNTANAFIKRAIDIVGSLVLIILTSPLMLFAAIGVKLTSKGPIIFKQVRVGRMGKHFKMWKFRSMYVNKDQDKGWTTGTDPRKTRFGTFLRRMAIDELPQFFNVLAGSMSLVGPRPELPHFVEEFKETVPLYMVKHFVKPGVTGLAQIKGFRGDTSIEARIHEDINYIENWSLGLELYILFKTPFKAINKSEVYVGSDKKDGEGDTTAEKSDADPKIKSEDVSDKLDKAPQNLENGSHNAQNKKNEGNGGNNE